MSNSRQASTLKPSRAPRSREGKKTLRFENNRHLADLCGENDRHLAMIENRLGVTLFPRGNMIAIEGNADACAMAETVLNGLYQRRADGKPVELGDVEGAIRLVLGCDGQRAMSLFADAGPKIQTQKRVIEPRSPTQATYMEALGRSELVFGLGPAGTGKTYLAVAHGVSLLLSGHVDRLVLSRPAVEAGERLGFLPGDMRDKVDPYLRPLYDGLHDTMAGDQVNRRMESGDIEVAPLAFMRGRTLANAFVILDEAQNATPMQMKMFLTRLGEGARMVVTGDPSQIDLPPNQPSGLIEAQRVLAKVPGIEMVTFTDADVVRHPLVSRIVRAYNAYHGPSDRQARSKDDDDA